MQPRSNDLAVLAVGVAAVSSAAVLIREAQAPALVISAFRLGLASLPLLLYAAMHRQTSTPAAKGKSLLLCILAGILLALHFGFWVSSVQKTSVVTSVVLVTAQPLFVALASGPLLGERVRAATWIGLVIATIGALLMVANDLGRGSETLQGDVYALLGALFAAGYFLTGRRLQMSGLSWLSYVSLVYPVAAVILIGAAAASGEAFLGYSTRTYGFMLLLALVPQLIGHTALNRSLGYIPAVAVTIAVLGEPVGATVLAAVFLDEVPDIYQLFGGLLLLLGVYAGLRGASSKVA